MSSIWATDLWKLQMKIGAKSASHVKIHNSISSLSSSCKFMNVNVFQLFASLLLKRVLNLPKSVLTMKLYNGSHLTFCPHMRIISLGGQGILDKLNAPCATLIWEALNEREDAVKKAFKNSTRTSNNQRIIKVCSAVKKRIGSFMWE